MTTKGDPIFSWELLEQNTFSENDQKRLERFERKEKGRKFVNEINDEIGEFFEDSFQRSNGDANSFMKENGITASSDPEGGRARFPFYKHVAGQIVKQPLTFTAGYTSLEQEYNAFVRDKLQPYIDEYNNTTRATRNATAKLGDDIAEGVELGLTRHQSRTLDNTQAFRKSDIGDDLEDAEEDANKYEGKRQNRLLSLLEREEDAVKDTIKEYLKSNHKELNKKQRKEIAGLIFDKLYTYSDIAQVPDSLQFTSTGKNAVTISVAKAAMASIFTEVQTYKTKYHTEAGLTADRRGKRFQRKLENAEQDKSKAFGEYTGLLDASKKITIDGTELDVTNEYRTAVLLSDINFDGSMVPASDLTDEQFRRNRLGKFFVEGVLRSVGQTVDKQGDGQNYRKYAKSFKNQPINNNLETQISTSREVAKARVGATVVETNLRALLEKGFTIPAADASKPFYELLKTNMEYSIFLRRIFVMEPDILVGLFEEGPQALETKYNAQQRRRANALGTADLAAARNKATILLEDPKYNDVREELLAKVTDQDVEKAKQGLIELRDNPTTSETEKKKLDALISSLDKPENRDRLRWQIASGGLMAIVAAQYRERHQVIPTYSNIERTPVRADTNGNWLPQDLAYNPDGTPKEGTSPINFFEDANTRKDKIRRTNFTYGLATGGTLLADNTGRYKQSVTYGISALYTDFAAQDPSGQKDGMSFGLSLGYNGTVGLGRSIGTTDIYKTNVNFGLGAGLGVAQNGDLVVGPYAYLGADQLLNAGKLTHTLDARGAVRLKGGVSASANKGLLSFVPNIGLSNDRIEGYTIIEDNLKNKVGPILETILLGLKGKDLSAPATQAEMEKMYADVIMGIDEKLGRSKPRNLNKAAKLLSGILSVYAGSEITQNTDTYDDYVRTIAPELAAVFANQWRNENIEDLRGWKITSVNVGPIFSLALFGLSPVAIAAAVAGTVGFTRYGRAVAENQTQSLANAKEDFENNYSATDLEFDQSSYYLGIGNPKSEALIRSTLVSKNAALAPRINELIQFDQTRNALKIHKDVAGVIEVRTGNAIEMSDGTTTVSQKVSDYLLSEGDYLLVPADMVGGMSELVDKNTRKTTLSIGIPSDAPISTGTVWDGTTKFTGSPEQFRGEVGTSISRMNQALQAIKNTSSQQLLTGYTFQYDNATLKLLNGSGAEVASAPATDLLTGNNTVTITKNAAGTFRLNVTAPKTPTFSGIQIEYNDGALTGGSFGPSVDLNFASPAYEGLFLPAFEKQFHDPKLLQSILRGRKYSSIYNAFNAAMVTGDFASAQAKAGQLLAALKADGRINETITFDSDPIKSKQQLFRFESLCIYSNACECDLDAPSGTVSFDKFVYKRDPRYTKFDGLMAIREAGFANRVGGSFPENKDILINTRTNVANRLKATAANNNQSLDYSTRPNSVALVFGYPVNAAVKDQLEEKIVYNPRVINDSVEEIVTPEPAKNKELINAFARKMEVINGPNRMKDGILAKLATQQAKDEVTNNFAAIQTALEKGEVWKGTYATVDLNFSFFFYPNCANEGVLMDMLVTEATETVTPYQGLVEKQLAGPTGFWTNDASVMQRAAVSAVNVGVTAAATYTQDTPEYVTTDIQVPESPTTVPEMHLIVNGQEITVPLAPGNGIVVDLDTGMKLGIQFTGYDNNGVPQWNFNYMTDQYGLVAEFHTLSELQNGMGVRGQINDNLQQQLISANKAYADQVTRNTTPGSFTVPNYLTREQIAAQAVQWIDHDRKGMKITVTDRIRKKK